MLFILITWHVSVLLQCFIISLAVLDYSMLTYTVNLFKWHQLLISHALPSLFLSSFSISLFLPHTALPVNLQLAIQIHLTEYSCLVCTLWLYGRVFVGLIAGPHLNVHAHGHCWGCNEPHSCHALSFMTKTHRFPLHSSSHPLLPPLISHRSLSFWSDKLMHFIPWTYPHVRC